MARIAFICFIAFAFALSICAKPIVLAKSSDSSLLAKTYPTTNFYLKFAMTYTKPGIIVDTVGINAAPIGSFFMSIDDKGHIVFAVYDPMQQSAGRVDNGWHLLTSTATLTAGVEGVVAVEVQEREIILWINEKLDARLQLAATLSQEPIYVGDFPGDDGWSENYRIHPAMIGTFILRFLGDRKDASAVSPTNPDQQTPADPLTPPTTNTPVVILATPEEIAGANAGITKVSEAFASGKVDQALALTSPMIRKSMQEICGKHPDALAKIAVILATRKLIMLEDGYAEYEVTGKNGTYLVSFQRFGDLWVLDGL